MSNQMNMSTLTPDPQTALEVQERLKELKTRLPAPLQEAMMQAIGGVTHRDVIFYLLGRYTGHSLAIESFEDAFRRETPRS